MILLSYYLSSAATREGWGTRFVIPKTNERHPERRSQ